MAQTDTYRISSDVCFCSSADGVAILNVRTGKLYSLIGNSSELWRLLAEGKQLSARQIAGKLVPCGQTDLDSVEKFLNQTSSLGLLDKTATDVVVTRSFRSQLCLYLASSCRALLCLTTWTRSSKLGALSLLAMLHVAGKLGGFQTRAAIVRNWPTSPRRQTEDELEKLAAAVSEACTLYPKESRCLQRASALNCLLRQNGFPSAMKIGIRKQPFYAHAWVELEGVVVGDHVGVQKYFESVATW